MPSHRDDDDDTQEMMPIPNEKSVYAGDEMRAFPGMAQRPPASQAPPA